MASHQEATVDPIHLCFFNRAAKLLRILFSERLCFQIYWCAYLIAAPRCERSVDRVERQRVDGEHLVSLPVTLEGVLVVLGLLIVRTRNTAPNQNIQTLDLAVGAY